MVDDLRQWYRDALAGRIQALEALKKGLHEGSPDASDSLRRVAHSLRGSGETYGFAEITTDAAVLEEADAEELPGCLDKLLSTLYIIASGADPEKTGILVIDDDPEMCKFLETTLSGTNRDVLVAKTGAEAEEILSERDVSLVLLDLILPDTDGRSLLLRLRERAETAGIPVIVLSAKVEGQAKIECFALGADDYFEKPVDPDILAATVASRLERTAQISRKTHVDVLTQLPNRAAFKLTFDRMLSFASRVKAPLSLSLLDLDHFKNINDTYGHLMGDEVLRRLAHVVSKSFRKYDSLARWGGEEFVALLPNTNRSGGVRAMEKALLVASEERFKPPNGKPFFVTFSAGVTEVPEGETVEEAIAEADRLLYLAKASGRNRVLSAEEDVESSHEKILLAEDDDLVAKIIKHRLELEGFKVLHYVDGSSAFKGAQETVADLAIIDVKMPEMDGFELLRRLRGLPSYGHTPIMMLTRMGREKDIARGFQVGADDYVLKPFSIVELLARVHRLLKRL